ncbi:MAG: thioredoxin domain-containing protein [Halosimplex sp.]
MNERGRRAPSRRAFLAGVGTAVGAGVAGCLGGGPDLPDETPTGPVATAPVPDAPGEYTYATMGSADAPVRAVYYGNWKCPYCSNFSTGSLGDVVGDYVEPGDVALTFRCLAYVGGEPFLGKDAPRAARAGLAVWNVDPATYWRYHEYVMTNQPAESKEWATVDTLVGMAKKAGVSDPDAVRSAVTSGKYASPVRKTARRASRLGLRGTPALVVGDRAVNPLDAERTRAVLDGAIDSATGGSAATGTESG